MCAKLLLLLLLEIFSAGFSKEETVRENAEIPEFIVTEQEFPKFNDLKAKESKSQVFSIWNKTEETESYYFFGQAPDDIEIELKKKGDLFYKGKMPGKKIKLTTLNPGENMVFEITVLKEKNESGEVELFFKNSHCDKK